MIVDCKMCTVTFSVQRIKQLHILHKPVVDFHVAASTVQGGNWIKVPVTGPAKLKKKKSDSDTSNMLTCFLLYCRMTEHLELAGTHNGHHIQHLSLHRTAPRESLPERVVQMFLEPCQTWDCDHILREYVSLSSWNPFYYGPSIFFFFFRMMCISIT